MSVATILSLYLTKDLTIIKRIVKCIASISKIEADHVKFRHFLLF